MSYDDARRRYEAAEPPEGRGRPLTSEQRAALRVVGAMLDERGIDKIVMLDTGDARWTWRVCVGEERECSGRDLALAVEDALMEVE